MNGLCPECRHTPIDIMAVDVIAVDPPVNEQQSTRILTLFELHHHSSSSTPFRFLSIPKFSQKLREERKREKMQLTK